MSAPVGRRAFLQILGASTLLGACGSAMIVELDERGLRAAGRVAELIEPQGADAIGRAYLAELEHEDTETIAARLEPAIEILDRDHDAAATAFRDAIGRDFRSGHVVAVAGWTLSATEAQACLLLHLQGGA